MRNPFWIILVCVSLSGSVFSQIDHKYCQTDFYPSPDGKKVIIVDRAEGEIGCFGYNSRLYRLPLSCNDYVSLNIFDHIKWDNTSTRIVTTTISDEGFVDGQTFVNTSIVIYDTTSKLIDEIKYASSPEIWGMLYFCREYDTINKTFAPMLYQYNFFSKKEDLIFKFDAAYTFWGEQFDFISYPKIRFRQGFGPTGITGLLIKKDNKEDYYTFVVEETYNGGKLLFWKKGDYFNDRNLPLDGFVK